MAVNVKLKKGDLQKKGVVGFSWTTFLFNFFVPLFRGDIQGVGLLFGSEFAVFFAVGLVGTATGVSEEALGFIGIIALIAYRIAISFIYNKRYTEKWLREGFEPVDDADRAALVYHGLYSK